MLAFNMGLVAQLPVSETTRATRKAVITIDDLPVVWAFGKKQATEITSKLLATLKKHHIESVGFVNTGKVFARRDTTAYLSLLQMWIDNGQELANHSYSHYSLNDVSTETFTEDIRIGETHIKTMMANQNKALRYFRHPYLHTGNDSLKKANVDHYIDSLGYIQAPVTASYYDWLYAGAYFQRFSKSKRKQIATAYIDYINRDLEFNENYSQELFGREIPMILLFHANSLNADHFEAVLQVLHNRGYEIITLEEALRDPVFEMGNQVLTDESMTWLQRWAIQKGQKPKPIPLPEAQIYKWARMKPESDS